MDGTEAEEEEEDGNCTILQRHAADPTLLIQPLPLSEHRLYDACVQGDCTAKSTLRTYVHFVAIKVGSSSYLTGQQGSCSSTPPASGTCHKCMISHPFLCIA